MRPLAKLPGFPVYHVADPSERQYLLMWNLVHSAGGTGDVDYVQIAVGRSNARPRMVVTSRSLEGNSFESVAQLGMLALSPESVQELARDQAGTALGGPAEVVTSSPVGWGVPWRDGTLRLDDEDVPARFASSTHEWIAVAAASRALVAVVGRTEPPVTLSLTAVREDLLERMTLPNGQVLDER